MIIFCNDPFGGVSTSAFTIKVPSSPHPQPSASASSHSLVSHSSCSHPCPKLPSHRSPTTSVVTNCTIRTGCALIVLENTRQKARLPSFYSCTSSSPQSIQEVTSSPWSVTLVLLLGAAHNALNTPQGSAGWEVPEPSVTDPTLTLLNVETS